MGLHGWRRLEEGHHFSPQGIDLHPDCIPGFAPAGESKNTASRCKPFGNKTGIPGKPGYPTGACLVIAGSNNYL